MCGITGAFTIEATQRDLTAAVQRMNNCIAHRGPDDAGIFCENGVALGHRRLSIIDLSADGHQPMFSSDQRFVVVYNGEIYNYKEIAGSLQGLRTGSDTEVLLESWANWGAEALPHLNGMFAFALYDRRNEELHIVRDRLGIKPLYYTEANGTLFFASEIRALMEVMDGERTIDPQSLIDYLRYQTVHAPATIIKGIKMLMPGERMLINRSGIKHISWWKPTIRVTSTSYEEAREKCKTLLRNAVNRRLVSDVPFGAFLSGGIDSSAVVALMSEVAVKPVQTFCVTFDESDFSEAKFARIIAEKYKTVHHEIHLSPGDFLESLPEALDAMDHPSGDGINTYVVSKATKKAGITMALSGLGGDELFAGYDVFNRSLEIERKHWLNTVPFILRKTAAGWIRAKGQSSSTDKKADVLSLRDIHFENFYPITRRVLSEEQIGSILKTPVAAPNRVHEIAQRVQKSAPGQETIISKVTLCEISTYMQNVLLRDADQMSMASALEVRVPFLDYLLVEYVLGLGDEMKYPVTPKKLLVDALDGLLPPEITDRRKMGFVFPWEHWMRGELKSFCTQHIGWLCDNVVMFDPQGVQNLWQGFLTHDKRISWSRVWPLVVLSYWMQKNKVSG